VIAAIYARKSTDDSDRDAEARSCERQIEHGRRYAVEQGWTVDDRYVYRDDAVSGAEWKHRPGWTALVATLDPQPPFARLIVSELSRIGRDSVRTPVAVLHVEEAGIEIHGYLNRARITLGDEAGEMSTMLNSLLASFERRRASARTTDEIARLFSVGAATGGAAYGYRIERAHEGADAHYVIDEAEALAVTRVFTLYDEGRGLGAIAKALTADRVPAPRGGNVLGGRAAPADVETADLRGAPRVPADDDPVQGRDEESVRPPQHHRVAGARGARAGDHRPRAIRSCPGAARGPGGQLPARAWRPADRRPRGGDVNPTHLLSGLLYCARCGSAIGPVVGRPGSTRYVCAGYHRRGRAACGNGLRVSARAFEEALIDAVAARLEPDVVAEAARGAVALLNTSQAEAGARRAAIATELATIATRERRLLDALVDGDGTAEAIRGRLRAELARRDTLAAELVAIDTATPIDAEAVVRDVERRTADLRGLLRRHPAQARQVVRLVISNARFRCAPFDDARGQGYDVTAPGSYSPLFTVRDLHTRLARLRAIALTRSPAWPVRRQNSRARSIAPRWEK